MLLLLTIVILSLFNSFNFLPCTTVLLLRPICITCEKEASPQSQLCPQRPTCSEFIASFGLQNHVPLSCLESTPSGVMKHLSHSSQRACRLHIDPGLSLWFSCLLIFGLIATPVGGYFCFILGRLCFPGSVFPLILYCLRESLLFVLPIGLKKVLLSG